MTALGAGSGKSSPFCRGPQRASSMGLKLLRLKREDSGDGHFDHRYFGCHRGQRQRDRVAGNRWSALAGNDDADKVHRIGRGHRERGHIRESAGAVGAQALGGFGQGKLFAAEP